MSTETAEESLISKEYSMARTLDAKCRLCRRAGDKLFLRGDRCFSQKCAMIRRPYAPGAHGKNGGRGASEFGRQLAMKQKIKRIYGVLEKQFRKHFEEVRNKKGAAGDLLLFRLEKRFDNVVYRMGLAASRGQGRQMITHGMFAVNGKKMDIPSAEIRVGDVISVRTEKTEKKNIQLVRESLKSKKAFPVWVDVDTKTLTGTVKANPTREDIDANVSPQIVVEYYSK